MERFEIHVPDTVLEDLKTRLARARFPDEYANDDWEYGTNLAYLKEICAYWRDGFDWRAQEAKLNAFAHFRTEIDGRSSHFVHHRSPHEDAFPIVVQHGWPGSIFEFHKMLDMLSRPEDHGGEARDAFHVVCPSIPGYGWSEAPSEPGFDIKSVAETNIALMAKLGYETYGAQGGDWGAVATAWTAAIEPPGLVGAHMNMRVGFPPRDADPMEGVTPEEAAQLAKFQENRDPLTAYQAVQRTKPQSLGYGLNDSPVGLAAWVLEKFHAWSDCGGDIESRFTKDELLTNIMIYWVNANMTSALRLYYETHHSPFGARGVNVDYVDTPCGFAVFPVEIYHPARAWMERLYNVVHWSPMPRGGHFAALEEPGLLAEDIRAFFRPLRPTS